MSLLHDLLRPPQAEFDALKLHNTSPPKEEFPVLQRKSPPESGSSSESDDDSGSVGLSSIPPTPLRSRQHSRQHSPTRPGSRAGPSGLRTDVTRTYRNFPGIDLPVDIRLNIFIRLTAEDLLNCSLVCKKWNQCKSLNYVWFLNYRKDMFQDERINDSRALTMAKKWTNKEKGQNWRVKYGAKMLGRKSEPAPVMPPFSRPSSRANSRETREADALHHDPRTSRQKREEKWALEEQVAAKPTKLESRAEYKLLGGRKPLTKGAGVWEKSNPRDRTYYEGQEWAE